MDSLSAAIEGVFRSSAGTFSKPSGIKRKSALFFYNHSGALCYSWRKAVHSVTDFSFLVNMLDLRLFYEVSDHPHAMHRNHKHVAMISYISGMGI